MRLLVAFILLLIISLSIQAQPNNYKFRRLDTTNGLSNNQIQKIFVDSRGFAWFSTVSGLNRFDGYNFRVFRHIPGDSTSMPIHSINRIYEDHKGCLWMFGNNNDLAIYNPFSETFSNDNEIFNLSVPVARNYISALLVDSDSTLWIGNYQFGIYHYNPKTKTIDHLLHRDGDASFLRTNNIVGIAQNSKGDVWTINRDALLEQIDPKTLKVIDRIQLLVNVTTNEPQWYNIFIDKDDDIWVYSENDATGLYLVKTNQKKQIVFNTQVATGRLSSNIITGITQDSHGMMWIGTNHGGINLLNKQTFSVNMLRNEPGDVNSLSQNSVINIFKDQSGIIWVGTFKNGICYHHPELFQFGLYQYNPFKSDGLPANDIDCFAEDRTGNLWIGTNGNGLIYYNRFNNTFKSFKHNPTANSGLSNDVIVCLCNDHNNQLWAGTYFGGVNMFDGNKWTVFKHNPDDPHSIADDRIWQIAEDSKQRLWLGTLGGGLDLYDPLTKRFLHYKSGDLNSVRSDFILALYQSHDDNLWIGTSNGFDILNHTTGRFSHYEANSDKPNSLSNNLVISFLHDKRGWMWIGTRSGLNCFDKATNTFRVLTIENGLPDNNIISLQEDSKGNVWMSTSNGLACINLLTDDSPSTFTYQIKSYDLMDGLQGREFNEHAGFKTRKGELLFGGVNGFNMFIPEEIVNIDFHPQVVLTDLKLQNRSIKIGEKINGNVILSSVISSLKEIELPHNQNVFSFEFTALNYLYPDRVAYRYKLDGFNNDWISTDANNRQATYTNLNPGDYLFRVAALGRDGNWSKEECTLLIKIVPPFYASKWAIALYFIFFACTILLLIYIIRKREHFKYQRRQERLEHQRMHELDAMKIRFFTNVSHEFRTPLTLILTPLDKLMRIAPNDEIRDQLMMIQRNGKRLLNLVNQLLDFRKMEVQTISVNPSFGNIINYLKETADSFTDLSESKNISYHFSSPLNELFMWFDHDKIEKILFNLMSNAFKFTPANGSVTVSVDVIKQDNSLANKLFDGKDYVELRVSDTGIGIAPDRLEKVFDRFFQNEGTGAIANQGSGIGLSLTQEFVRLHNGVVTVESQLDKGSTFIVKIPVVSESNVQNVVTTELVSSAVDSSPLAVDDTEMHNSLYAKEEEDEKPLILIVEDNEDLRFYLKENLRQHYRIEEAENGEIAWTKTRDLQPMLVVTDVMMPVMDGLDLCRNIKQTDATSHIPVIILTARNSHEQKIEGFESGADDYITKPFNYEILEIKIRKLIDTRHNLHKTLNLQYEIKPGEIGVTSMDEKFIQRALELVENNISNTDFSVEKMSKEMGVSRGHLYNKIMALTGKTPIEFIRIMRLKRAAQLLEKSQMTVSEIAYGVGFNDPKYFSKYFKDEFKLSPSDYSKKMMVK